MDIIRLSPRLAAAADAAGEGKNIIDVGTDHGYVPVYLAQTTAARVTAADVKKAPLDCARRSAREYGVYERIRFVLADGLDFSGAQEADTVIIAGMGGETIEQILSRAPWTRDARLILQPQTKIDELCLWLGDNGYRLLSANLCRDAGRLYAVMTVTGGTARDVYLENVFLRSRDVLLAEWLSSRIAACKRALELMGASSRADSAPMRELLERLETVNKECGKWQA